MYHPINNLAYHIEIEGSGPPLLLLHGFIGSGQSWQEVLPLLTAHYTVLRVDLPGHGRTALPDDVLRYSMSMVARDLVQLLTHLQMAPAQVWGYSMGARLALILALDYPEAVRCLLLESGSPGLISELERAARRTSDEALAQRIEQHGIEAFVAEWEHLPMWASQVQLPMAQRGQLHERRLQNSIIGLANSLRYMGTGAQPSVWSRLPELRVPVALVVGALDSKFVQIAREMQQACPTASLHMIEGAGHAVHLERMHEIVQVLGRDCAGVGYDM